MFIFDPRTTPARPNLAAAHLAGKVNATRFVEGRAMHVAVELTDLHRAPDPDAPVDTQILFGENLVLYDMQDGWGWVQLAGDDYVGYVAMSALAEGEAYATHRVTANRTFIYPRPDIKAPVLAALPLGAEVEVIGADGNFARLASGGFVIALHLMRADETADDFVAIAEGFHGTPYLWGGKSGLGIDCSGLVQIALGQIGIAAPRDTDLQQAALGVSVPIKAAEDGLQRGDLIYWKGHVGIMRDAETLLHANAHHMLVASEPLSVPRARILSKGAGDIAAIKRLPYEPLSF
jgi:cell wall-associated NlpC family hydrolase